MENKTAFDLNRAIQQWRDKLLQPAIGTNESVEELESHLRDSMSALQASGLTMEESFLIARNRIGGSDDIDEEFAKIHSGTQWLSVGLFLLIGIQLSYAFFNRSLPWPLVLVICLFAITGRSFRRKVTRLLGEPLKISIAVFVIAVATRVLETYLFWLTAPATHWHVGMSSAEGAPFLAILLRGPQSLVFLLVSLVCIATIALLSRARNRYKSDRMSIEN